MISIMVGHFDYKHRFLVVKNVPIALILPNRWQDGAESLGMERTIFLWLFDYQNKLNGNPGLHLFIFVLFHTSTEFVQKTFVGIEGKQADHLTTTTAQD